MIRTSPRPDGAAAFSTFILLQASPQTPNRIHERFGSWPLPHERDSGHSRRSGLVASGEVVGRHASERETGRLSASNQPLQAVESERRSLALGGKDGGDRDEIRLGLLGPVKLALVVHGAPEELRARPKGAGCGRIDRRDGQMDTLGADGEGDIDAIVDEEQGSERLQEFLRLQGETIQLAGRKALLAQLQGAQPVRGGDREALEEERLAGAVNVGNRVEVKADHGIDGARAAQERTTPSSGEDAVA